MHHKNRIDYLNDFGNQSSLSKIKYTYFVNFGMLYDNHKWRFLTHKEGLVYSQDTLLEECEDSKKGITGSKAAKHGFEKTWTVLFFCIFLWRVAILLFNTVQFFLPFFFQTIPEDLNSALEFILITDSWHWHPPLTDPLYAAHRGLPAPGPCCSQEPAAGSSTRRRRWRRSRPRPSGSSSAGFSPAPSWPPLPLMGGNSLTRLNAAHSSA